MRPPRVPLLALGLLLAARLAFGLPPLFDNGRAFCLPGRRPDFACLDAPGLLDLGAAARDRLLDHAARAGFSAVSFDAPLFGPKSLVPKFGAFGGAQAEALERVLGACGRRGLYAFPVLYPPSGVDGLVGTATARAVFFSGRRAWGWERWALAGLAGLKLDGVPLARARVVGGWILYRGPWPGGVPLAGPAPLTPSVSASDAVRFRAWAAATVRAARQLGFRQELGVGLWLGDDLAPDAGTPNEAPDAASALSAAPPLSPLDPVGQAGRAAASDALPAVPGSPDSGLDDSAVLPPAPGYAGPDALDWTAIRTFMEAFPRVTQLDFLECTLDSEDWFDAGARLAEAARSAEVPVLWRQDWRQAPRYERSRHLEAPVPLAGLGGPWPDDDWQAGLWGRDPRAPARAPFYVRNLRLERGRGGAVRLDVLLSRPADLKAAWGPLLPLRHHASLKGRPSSDPSVPLGRIAPGAWFLLKLEADSPRYGVCLLRTQWIRAP